MQPFRNLLPPVGEPTPASLRMLECLEMYDEGVELQTLNFRRRFPHLSDAQIDELVQDWLERREET
ncbi:MAG: hypothetical protein SF187_10465 [Deltaproteobacteria bacterium]|nr:hypothetical protein [Deltaproteobacteria bacterium]